MMRFKTLSTMLPLALVVQIASLTAEPLLPNGSFESGSVAPESWQLHATGEWTTGEAHSGEHCLSARSTKGDVVWASQNIPLQSQTDYRLDGWLRCRDGQARLNVELLDAAGKVIRVEATPAVHHAADWRYAAVEWNAGNATSARVGFWVQGRADLDDAALAPVAASFIGNKLAEGDARGRISFWNEEKDDKLLTGRRAGTHRLDAEIKHEGRLAGGETNATSVQLNPSGDWYAISSINYGLAAWTEKLELSGWARGEASASAQILACWLDDLQKVVRVDASAPIHGQDWQRISLIPLLPPSRAATVRLVAVARGGKVWFDDFDLVRLRPRWPLVRVFVNQAGYEQDGPKSAVVAANFFPTGATTIAVQVLTPDRTVVWRQDISSAGRIYGGQPDDWGWYFWRADFSPLQQTGSYRVRARIGNTDGQSFSFPVGRHELLEKTAKSAVDFFFVQRCGFAVPGWHKACHLDDALLPDGQHIDATGGWHSAGDYNKLMYENGDGGVLYALLSAYDDAPDYFKKFDRNGDGMPDALEEAQWGAQFVAKMQIPESGALRNTVSQGPGRNWTKWSIPEAHTDNIIGTADDPVVQPGEGNSPLAIGGWARLAELLKQRSVKSDYLDHAVRLWNHATKAGTQVGSPHLLLSALQLHQVTQHEVFLNYARRSADSLLASQTTNGISRGAFGGFGELTAGALAQYALDYPNEPLVPRIKRALKDYVTFCVSTADNAFGLSKQTVGKTDNFFPSDLGNNFQLLQRAWAAALIYQLTYDKRAWQFATDQVDWILGKNPYNLCMFEGLGSVNPPRYHHRYNMIPGRERGAVPGTIPNGFVRELGMADRPGFDLSRGGNRAPSYRTSEPWLVHNMWYLLALSALDGAGRNNSRF
ncbi:MAG: glycoside hydrolase family 9 protein [Verrucomicrobia bacterium]|nr:glycoside hydrolase family 9 protein [Verrucomicrobiota bacterium]